VRAVADPGSPALWDDHFDLNSYDSPDYVTERRKVERATGATESVLCGTIRVGGVGAVVIAWEFGYLGGSVGVNTAARIVAAIRRATDLGVPLLALPRSGGTRMQEGAPAFIQMVAIAGAVVDHRAAGLPYLVHLCGPTTGGVLATLGSAGDLTTAEPDAMIGFLGPRAYRAITGQAFPEGVQTAENLLARGLLDAVLPWAEVGPRWATLLNLWSDRAAGAKTADLTPPAKSTAPAPTRPPARGHLAPPSAIPGAPTSAAGLWAYVAATRSHDRIDAAQFMAAHVSDKVVLPGTGTGERSEGAVVALGRLLGLPVVMAATTDRWTGEALTVGGLRTIRRGIALAGRWGLPVVTIVDTLGAQLSVEGENSGIAGEISRLMVDLVSAPVPTAALLLGAGTGGAALAMLATDRIIAGSHTWVAPLAPEGAAAIRHGGAHDPAQVAWEQRIGAHSLAGLGFIDVVVRESDPEWVSTAARALVGGLADRAAGTGTRRRVERFSAWNATRTD
jgi:acyl-CoA carboxylase subunit beta